MRSSDWSSDVCSSDLVVGQQARRNLKANDVLHPGMVEAARLVKRGDLVVVSAEDGRVAVRSQGIALQDGAEGARSEEHTSELQSLMRISYAVFCFIIKTTTLTSIHINRTMPINAHQIE